LNVVEFIVYLKNTGTVILFALNHIHVSSFKVMQRKIMTVQDFCNIGIRWFCCSHAYLMWSIYYPRVAHKFWIKQSIGCPFLAPPIILTSCILV